MQIVCMMMLLEVVHYALDGSVVLQHKKININRGLSSLMLVDTHPLFDDIGAVGMMIC